MVDQIYSIAKIIKIGNSIGITISKDVKDVLGLKTGDYIQISIKKIMKEPKDET